MYRRGCQMAFDWNWKGHKRWGNWIGNWQKMVNSGEHIGEEGDNSTIQKEGRMELAIIGLIE
jgi:hypothetical protein